MARKRHKPEEIVAKLRQVDVLTSQGQSVPDAISKQATCRRCGCRARTARMGARLLGWCSGASGENASSGVWRATLIQRTRHLDSIVARALLVADFIDSIGQKLTSAAGSPIPHTSA
ncbi:MAG: hypothetical protein JJE37_08155 [Methyloceanibacter sp.]|nr:hypothetical protein [Methyloceanibacter sp.]